MSTASAPEEGKHGGAFFLRSFRTKIILVVGLAVLFNLLVGATIGMLNVRRLSNEASAEIERGLTNANREYVVNYIQTTGLRLDLVLDRIHSEVDMLAGAMQSLVDHPKVADGVGKALSGNPDFGPRLIYDRKGAWAQNAPGSLSVTSVWGYLLKSGVPLPKAASAVDASAPFDILAPSMMERGAKKLQMYYVGPKTVPIMRTTPYADQAQTFDKLYPGHNDANFWDFFFPGVYEGWQGWIKDPESRPIKTSFITATAPYIDAITGKLIVSFFRPLWTQDRKDVAGMTAADVTLEQLAEIVEGVRLAETGFAFLALSDTNVIAVKAANEARLGLKIGSQAGQGVTGLNRKLAESTMPAVAGLALPSDGSTLFTKIMLQENGVDVPYIVALHRLSGENLWDAGKIRAEYLTLGFAVPEREIFAPLVSAQVKIDTATTRIIRWQIGSLAISLVVVLLAVFGVSGRITAGLSNLATAARRLRDKDYSVRVAVGARDEVGEVGLAFNSMAEEMRQHTENLETLVDQRTRALEEASAQILSLNARLESENSRLATEIGVARQIQMMVLPGAGEVGALVSYDVAGYMEPADEVGGDYYDVIQAGGHIKIGIGDVTGHGLESGVFMLMVQSITRALLEQGVLDPMRFLTVLNRAITKNLIRSGSDKHMTLAFLDITADNITLSGQHEEVLVLRNDGSVERIDTMDLGFPVGLEDEIEDFVATRTIDLASDEVVVLYTDGITEAENESGAFYGLDLLCESIQRHGGKSADALRDGVLADLKAYIGTQKVHDDITLVIVKKR